MRFGRRRKNRMDRKNNTPFGIMSDVDTMLRLFEEFQKRGVETREEREKVMLEFFSRKENKEKIQDVLVGEDDFYKQLKDKKTILSGEVKNGKASWNVYRKDKENGS